ncbi:hypothetical protein [Roseovarius atlanticus]|uniref:hypothetical protein n=1 Tax=Roseovarius atlanticus TaxID=1641875 RepID=UPI001C94BCEB|nr:hypothetical protein [Roseovarius atlanticus]MBY5988329.1 hypothetical protein [Roseovarius atlanticus]MBY6123720.1 hypothetical protein [Roseovarius atlanticus]MBY6148215.1 hypothetical protein [Roseovarius atlanticus]
MVSPMLHMEIWAVRFVRLFLLIFCIVQAVTLVWVSPDAYQRLGSFWVAVLLVLFGATRLVVSEMQKAFEGHGAFAEQFKAKLDEITYSDGKGWKNNMAEDGTPYERRLLTEEEIQKIMKDFEARIVWIFLSNELFLAAVATLQWGYGDMFHCFVHGQGFKSC